MTGVARVETYPLASWVVSVFLYLFCLCGSMSHLCWGRNVVKKGGWGSVNRSIAVLHIGVDDIGKYWNKTEVG